MQENYELNPEDRKIKFRSIRYKGEVFDGHTHLDALNKCRDKFPDSDYNDMEDGYTNDQGEFISKNDW